MLIFKLKVLDKITWKPSCTKHPLSFSITSFRFGFSENYLIIQYLKKRNEYILHIILIEIVK